MEGSHARHYSLTLRPGTKVLVPATSPSYRGRLIHAKVISHIAADHPVKVRILPSGRQRFVDLKDIKLPIFAE